MLETKQEQTRNVDHVKRCEARWGWLAVRIDEVSSDVSISKFAGQYEVESKRNFVVTFQRDTNMPNYDQVRAIEAEFAKHVNDNSARFYSKKVEEIIGFFKGPDEVAALINAKPKKAHKYLNSGYTAEQFFAAYNESRRVNAQRDAKMQWIDNECRKLGITLRIN
jgi:hypothetical protein